MGKPIDSTKPQGIAASKRLSSMPIGSKYTMEERLYAATLFSLTGNFMEVHRQTNIPHSTLREWRNCDWWEDQITKFREENTEELDIKLTNNIMKAVDAVGERLDAGEYVGIASDGSTRYRPVTAKEAATVMGILFDKRQILRNAPTRITQSVDGLAEIKAQFEAMINRKEKIVSDQ